MTPPNAPRLVIEDADQDTAEALNCDERFDAGPLVSLTEYDQDGYGVRAYFAVLDDRREDVR